MSVKHIKAVDPLSLIVIQKEITKVSQDSLGALTSKRMGYKISDDLEKMFERL